MNLAKFFGHDLNIGIFKLFDANGKQVYGENAKSFSFKNVFNANGNKIYYEDSDGFWSKREYDTNDNRIYYEDSDGHIINNRPKSCEGKTVEIDGIKYKLTEI